MKLEKLIIPQGDKILVLPKIDSGKTASGIVTKVNPTSGKKPQQGEVLAISAYLQKIWTDPLSSRTFTTAFTVPEQKVDGLSEGDQVIFSEYAGDNIEVKDLETGDMVVVKLLPAELVLGIISEPQV